MVTSGVVRRGAQVRVMRDGTVIYETSIAQLKRFKDDAREVSEGFECGILLDGFNDVKEGDVLEAYETREVERTELDRRPSPPRSPPPTTSSAAAVATGYVGILTVELHFPESGSLKGKRKYVKSAKAQLHERFGASVAEVDHHDLAALDARRGRARRASTPSSGAARRGALPRLAGVGAPAQRAGGGRPWRALSDAEGQRGDPEGALGGRADLKDPRIGFVTVTGAHDDRPLAGDGLRERARQRRAGADARGLGRRHGLLQTQVARELGTRRTPDVRIRSRDRAGVRLTKLIDELAPADSDVEPD